MEDGEGGGGGGALAYAAAGAPRRWACPVCTFVNSQGDYNDSACCEICETPRDATPWGCSTCTLLNPATEKRCKACGEKKKKRKKKKSHKEGKDKDGEESKRWKYAQGMESEEKDNVDVAVLEYEDRKMPVPAPPTPLPPPVPSPSPHSSSALTSSRSPSTSTSTKTQKAAAEKEEEEEEEDDDNEDDKHLRAREAFALSLFNEFVTSEEAAGAGHTMSSSSSSSGGGEKGGKPRLTCLCCGKMHSTRRIMVSVWEGGREKRNALTEQGNVGTSLMHVHIWTYQTMHFVRDHLGEFQGDLRLGNAQGLSVLRLQADAQLALMLQAREMEGEEEDEGEEEVRRVLAMARNSDEEGRLPSSRANKAEKRNVGKGGIARGGRKKKTKKEKEEKKKRARSSWSDEEEEESEDDSDSDDEGVMGPRRGGREGGEEEGEEEEEEEAMEGPTTRSGTTIRYRPTLHPSAAVDTGVFSGGEGKEGDGGRALSVLRPLESEREMEARTRRRLQLLVERTTAIRARLEEGIASLFPVVAAEGEGGGEEGKRALPEVVLEGRVLRDYQKVGVSWLLSLHQNQLNGILADEMVGGSLNEKGGRQRGTEGDHVP